MLRLKNVLAFVLALMMVCLVNTSVFAAEAANQEAIAVDVAIPVEVPGLPQSGRHTIQLDELLKNSIITKQSSNVVGGIYESRSYDAGLAGYTYQIEFEWEAEVNSSGDYVFKKIINPKIVTTTNYIITGLTWGYSSYEITQNTYTISSNKKSVTFNTTYKFKFMLKDDITGKIHELTQSHSRSILLNDLL